MTKVPFINISDYNYPLPDDRIARFPLEKRDQSKLLLYKDGSITGSSFSRIASHIPEGSLLVFNDTRVIRARLMFFKPEGARIEVFCLQPEGAYGQTARATWKCFIGNAKRWKSGELKMEISCPAGNITLLAERGKVIDDAYLVSFKWDVPGMPFEQVLEYAGKVPLPPYLNREPVESDAERYQTIYARFNGSVAAPTAGLHFTPAILESLEAVHCRFEYLTLHVGAGTFKPVSASDAREHLMHEEEVIVEKSFLLKLLQNLQGHIVPVGTTSMRTLESLYWLGVQIINGQEPDGHFNIRQWEPYGSEVKIPASEALQAIHDYLSRIRQTTIRGFTGIMIVPGYRFRICNVLITNFHQPQSTLLLLVAAFIGEGWKQAYQYALENDFRFLSYGDSCLFFAKNVEID
ncbi:MAG: S-adenosylmethionine:tRNA ribosyltransferase-isomerase [Bacteroidales bacterium]|nr:S-adenosylmethionine:tRNA ribosyltransferase-isomerase [Bacteroidales bacterium]